jgi:hypothetical protein
MSLRVPDRTPRIPNFIAGRGLMFGGGPPRTFSPSDLSDLILWLDAAQLVGFVNNDKVPAWNDLSSNAYSFANSTSASQPIYKTNVLNSQPGVDFSGTQVLIGSGATIFGTGSTPLTFIAVCDFRSYTAPGLASLATFVGPASDCIQVGFSNLAGINNFQWGAHIVAGGFGSARATATFSTTSQFYAISMTWDASGTAAGDYQFYSSNVATTTATASDNPFNVSENTIGAFNLIGQFPLTGSICEMIAYSRVLNSTERGQIQTYLNGKYAI